MKKLYTQSEIDEISSRLSPRKGWDFSIMKVIKCPTPWNYLDDLKKYLKISDKVLDVGTGGGEGFIELSPYFNKGVGIDIDPIMIKVARQNGKNIDNISFKVMDNRLIGLTGKFDIIICRQAPYNLESIKKHLKPSGYFITQQVGEKNMENIKLVIGQNINKPPITEAELIDNGFKIIEFKSYNVKYIVRDIDSLVFWLNALDMLHSDMSGKIITKDVDIFNKILEGNVSKQGFVTNEHRYLVVTQLLK